MTSSHDRPVVAEVMSADVVTISPGQASVSAAEKMAANDISYIVVVDNGGVVGIVTATDLLRGFLAKGRDTEKTTVREIMSSPVESVSADLSALDAGIIMEDKGIKQLPVLEGNELVGVVTQSELFGTVMDKLTGVQRHHIGIIREGSETPGPKKFLGRVLVAEDSQTNQLLIRLRLERMGLNVTIAEDGQQAVDKALGEEFDLILMDAQMPDMNGYEATKTLRRAGLTVPIIALTAHAMKGDDEKCISAGCDHYLPKPINQERLLEVIARYLPVQSESLSEKIESINSQVDEPAGPCVGSVQGLAERPKGALGRREHDGQADETSIGDTYASVIDWAGLRERVVDEREIEKVIAVFLGENTKLVGVLAGAVRAAKTSQVRVYASALRGSAANIGAKRLSDATHRLEVIARKKDLSMAESLLQEITREFERLQSFVSKPNWMEIAKQHSCSRQS